MSSEARTSNERFLPRSGKHEMAEIIKLIRVGGYSSMAEHLLPAENAGSIPSYPLQSLRVQPCTIKDIQSFIEQWHYSRSVFGITGSHFYRVVDFPQTVGAAIFGSPAAYNVARKYATDGAPLVELRRFCMVDDTPKNAESRVLGVMFRMLRKDGIRWVLSYADPAHGHVGTIYRATGFEYRGLTAKRKHIQWRGKIYPDRNLHQTKFPYHAELRAALLKGEATQVVVPGKHIYLKRL